MGRVLERTLAFLRLDLVGTGALVVSGVALGIGGEGGIAQVSRYSSLNTRSISGLHRGLANAQGQCRPVRRYRHAKS